LTQQKEGDLCERPLVVLDRWACNNW